MTFRKCISGKGNKKTSQQNVNPPSKQVFKRGYTEKSFYQKFPLVQQHLIQNHLITLFHDTKTIPITSHELSKIPTQPGESQRKKKSISGRKRKKFGFRIPKGSTRNVNFPFQNINNISWEIKDTSLSFLYLKSTYL